MFNERMGRMSDAEPMSMEDFQAIDEREESSDPNEMNLTKVMAMADVVIENDGNLEALKKKAIELLS